MKVAPQPPQCFSSGNVATPLKSYLRHQMLLILLLSLLTHWILKSHPSMSLSVNGERENHILFCQTFENFGQPLQPEHLPKITRSLHKKRKIFDITYEGRVEYVKYFIARIRPMKNPLVMDGGTRGFYNSGFNCS